MKKHIKLIPWLCLAFPSLFILNACNRVHFYDAPVERNTLYNGGPNLNTLTKSLQTTALFSHSAKRTAIQLDLYSKDSATGDYYSHYRIMPKSTIGDRSFYETKEDIKEGWRLAGIDQGQSATVNGVGISFGGIFWPQEMMTAENQDHKQVYYNKIEITSVTPISGQLFPLKVGNDLRFYFTRLHAQNIDGHETFKREIGIMEYQVTAHQSAYPDSTPAVPGDIYTIVVSEMTKDHPKKYMTDIYQYSTKLGWYILDKYYDKDNKLLAVYSLQNWH